MTSSPYKPIDSEQGEIRLLDVQPATDYETPVTCSMRTVRLGDRPVYEALSYTWGSKGAERSIGLDGIVLPVFENLEAALRRLRRSRETRTIWIDALCINQGDIDERGAQVKLMRDVYEIATQVNIWLGEPTPGAEIGLNRLTSSNPSTRAVRNRERHTEIETKFLGARPGYLSELRSSFSPSADLVRADLEKDEIRELLCRPWWNRVWIIQEAVVATKLKVLCGSWEIDWETLEAETKDQDLLERQASLSTFLDSELLSFSDNTFDNINRMRSKWAQKEAISPDSTLYSLLYSLRRLACTDPRDRVFAFLGLIPPSLRDVFSPSYSHPVGEIYSRFCKAVIAKTGTLDILNCTREWYGVSKPVANSRVYSIYDRARYFDLAATVKSGKGNNTLIKAPARLPDGWESCRDGGVVTYFDHTTQTRHCESPLINEVCQPSTQLDRQRCPQGCRKVWDNLGRADIEFNAREDVSSMTHKEEFVVPTWAPNWAARTARDPKPLLDWEKSSREVGVFRATGSSSAEAPGGIDGGLLSLAGFQFDTIEELGKSWSPASEVPPLTRTGIDELETWEALAEQDHHMCPYGGKEGRREALWRTQIGDYPNEGAVAPDARIWIEIWYNREGRVLRREDDAASSGPSIGWLDEASNAERFIYESWEKLNGKSKWINKLREMYDAWAVSRKYMPYLQRIYDTCAHRALFVTSRGYIGLAPWNAALGDTICLLEGGKTPFILRKAEIGSYYRFVGECYVYGIMGGEAMAEYSKLDPEIFNVH